MRVIFAVALRQRSRFALATLVMCFLGCSSFKEQHYFRAYDPATNETVNYFRLTVRGGAGVTKARYLSGVYDQKAVDFFFNELRTSHTPAADVDVPANQSASGEVFIAPLDTPNSGTGTFVMILSTNARSVADTIGEFADNQAVSDALVGLVNREKLDASRRITATAADWANQRQSEYTTLDSLFGQLVTAKASAAAVEDQCLRILHAIAVATGSPGDFATMDEAQKWFNGYIATRGQRK